MKRLFSTGLVLFLGMALQIGCGGGGSATGAGSSGNGGGGNSNGGGNNNGGGLVGGDGGTLCSLDAYQGNTCVQGQQATGFYHVEKVKNRYMWITPSGFGFFSKAVANVNNHDGGTTYSDALTAKYGNPFQD